MNLLLLVVTCIVTFCDVSLLLITSNKHRLLSSTCPARVAKFERIPFERIPFASLDPTRQNLRRADPPDGRFGTSPFSKPPSGGPARQPIWTPLLRQFTVQQVFQCGVLLPSKLTVGRVRPTTVSRRERPQITRRRGLRWCGA